MPLGPSFGGRLFFELDGEPALTPSERPTADMNVVSDEYFRTLDLPIREGRAFTASDLAGPPVCIVNQAFVERHFPGGGAVGRRVQTWQSEDPSEQSRFCEIVGVATSAKRVGSARS